MTYDDDERHGHAILAPLSDLGEPPPPAYNISAAVGTGRRRRIAAVAGIAAVTALAVAAAPTALATFRDGKQENVATSPSATPSVPALPSSCELNLLPEPAGMYSTIVGAMDPTGRFIAGYGESRVNGNMVSTPVLWQDGRPQLVGRRGLNVEVTDVNSRGVAVATTVPGEPAAWIYRDGELSRLSARSLEARAINERGDIVGATGDTNRPFVLCNAGTTRGVATDIDEDGTVVGRVFAANTGYTYVWFPDGKGARAPMAGPGLATKIRNGWWSAVTTTRCPGGTSVLARSGPIRNSSRSPEGSTGTVGSRVATRPATRS